MPNWKEGDRVKIVTRQVTEADRKNNAYFDHMAGLTGTVQNVYAGDEIAIKVDEAALSNISRDVHDHATKYMRKKFAENSTEEMRKQLTPEELNFSAHYVLLVQGADLEKAV